MLIHNHHTVGKIRNNAFSRFIYSWLLIQILKQYSKILGLFGQAVMEIRQQVDSCKSWFKELHIHRRSLRMI